MYSGIRQNEFETPKISYNLWVRFAPRIYLPKYAAIDIRLFSETDRMADCYIENPF